MSVLQPYIDSGKLVIGSGQKGMDKVSTLRWDGATAQARMDNLLSAFYGRKRVDAVLSPYDGLSIGILSSLKGVGYGSGNMPCVVSGQERVPSISRCCAPRISTIFKIPAISKVLPDMTTPRSAQEVTSPTPRPTQRVRWYFHILKPVVVDKSNWEKVLVASGYYKKSQFD